MKDSNSRPIPESEPPLPCHFVLLASGKGERFGAGNNKIFETLNGVPVFLYSLLVALRQDWIRGIAITFRQGELARAKRDVEKHLGASALPLEKIEWLEGGAERRLSVRNAMEGLKGKAGAEGILVHDAARPLATPELYRRLAVALRSHQAVFPACVLTETAREQTAEGYRTLERNSVLRAQTPQGLRWEHLPAFLGSAFAIGGDTDEMGCMEREGIAFRHVLSDETNLKITTAKDLVLAQRLIEAHPELDPFPA